jgi:transcriptional regulator with XRE-family HTH domain
METTGHATPVLTLGDRLAVARRHTGLSLREVAEHVPDVSMSALAKWEHNEREPSLRRMALLAKFYGVDIRWLIEGIDTDEVKTYGGRTRPGVHTGQTLLFELAAA